MKKKAKKAKRRVFDITLKHGMWRMIERGTRGTSNEYALTKKEIVKKGREFARRHQPSQLMIHYADGVFQTEHTYGADPERTPG